MSNQDGSAAPQGNPIITYYNEWADRTPFVTRNSLIGIVIVYILSWFIEADRQLGNMPYFTVMNFEFYRIITSPIVGNSIFSILMIFLFFPQVNCYIIYTSEFLVYICSESSIFIAPSDAATCTDFVDGRTFRIFYRFYWIPMAYGVIIFGYQYFVCGNMLFAVRVGNA